MKRIIELSKSHTLDLAIAMIAILIVIIGAQPQL